VTSGVFRIEVTVADNQLTGGVIFDTATRYYRPSVARLLLKENGTVVDHDNVVLSSYVANTPVSIRANINKDNTTWACAIDDELKGFGDDQVVSGLTFTNDPSTIHRIGTVYLWLFGSFNTYICTIPRAIGCDDASVVS
jgi:hypothetical protein